MPSALVSRLVLLSTLAVPVVAVGLQVYLVEHPLSSSRARTIKRQATLSASCASSPTLGIVNPNHHQAWTDSFSIGLSEREIGNASDEEILSRFVNRFFGGWTFTLESNILLVMHAFGRQLIPVGFANIQRRDSPVVLSPAELSRTSLPPAHTLLFGGNFLVLDVSLKPSGSGSGSGNNHSAVDAPKSGLGSHIDIAFGDNRKGFAGFHRFELSRTSNTGESDPAEGESGGATICFSSIACNPSVNRRPAPAFAYAFHKLYALTLFRDGIAGVLQT